MNVWELFNWFIFTIFLFLYFIDNTNLTPQPPNPLFSHSSSLKFGGKIRIDLWTLPSLADYVLLTSQPPTTCAIDRNIGEMPEGVNSFFTLNLRLKTCPRVNLSSFHHWGLFVLNWSGNNPCLNQNPEIPLIYSENVCFQVSEPIWEWCIKRECLRF